MQKIYFPRQADPFKQRDLWSNSTHSNSMIKFEVENQNNQPRYSIGSDCVSTTSTLSSPLKASMIDSFSSNRLSYQVSPMTKLDDQLSSVSPDTLYPLQGEIGGGHEQLTNAFSPFSEKQLCYSTHAEPNSDQLEWDSILPQPHQRFPAPSYGNFQQLRHSPNGSNQHVSSTSPESPRVSNAAKTPVTSRASRYHTTGTKKSKIQERWSAEEEIAAQLMTPSQQISCPPSSLRMKNGQFVPTDSQARHHETRNDIQTSSIRDHGGEKQSTSRHSPIMCSDVDNQKSRLPMITPVKTGKKVQYRKTKVCPWIGYGRCVMGDGCNYACHLAHAKVELRNRPDLTRTRLCPDGTKCMKTTCRFAHDLSQLRATGAFFRTKLCKFWIRGSCPSGDNCRHAHGEDQLRRPECRSKVDESPVEASVLSELYGHQNKISSPQSTSTISDFGTEWTRFQSVTSESSVSEASNHLVNVTKQITKDGFPLIGTKFTPVKKEVEGQNCKAFDYDNSDRFNYSLTTKHEKSSVEALPVMSELNFSQDNLFGSVYNDGNMSSAMTSFLKGSEMGRSDVNTNIKSNVNYFNHQLPSIDSTNTGSLAASISGDESLFIQRQEDMSRLVEVLTSNDPEFSSILSTTEQQNYNIDSFVNHQHQQPFQSGQNEIDKRALSSKDLRFNDILKIAIASEDPDLLECSAKLLRASQMFRKKNSMNYTSVVSTPSPKGLPLHYQQHQKQQTLTQNQSLGFYSNVENHQNLF